VSNEQMTGPVERFLLAIETAKVGACGDFSSDIELDATVPNWRMSIRGDDAVKAELSRWYDNAGTFEELHRTPLPTGELVEFTLRFEDGGIPHAVHQVHILGLAHEKIVRDQVWCGGRWSATLLAQMAEAADAVS
jgi:hypothetical protein